MARSAANLRHRVHADECASLYSPRRTAQAFSPLDGREPVTSHELSPTQATPAVPPLDRDPPRRIRLDARRLTAGGLALLAGGWWLAWFGPSPWSWYYFFPLWLGYILSVDGIVLWRTGTSLLTRNPVGFTWLFVFAVPLWWGYEAANERLGNWKYHLPDDAGPLRYVGNGSLSFSIVLPAVFETAELFRSFGPFRPARRWIRLAPSRPGLVALSAAGAALVVLALLFPRQAFPLIWVGFFLVLDPLNAIAGGKSILAQVARGRWDTVWVLFAAGLTCGLLWEGWNYWSSPKWIYHVPYVDWLRIFEMPLLGYGGYFPFALEVYATYQTMCLLAFRRPDDLLTFEEPAPARTEA